MRSLYFWNGSAAATATLSMLGGIAPVSPARALDDFHSGVAFIFDWSLLMSENPLELAAAAGPDAASPRLLLPGADAIKWQSDFD